MWAQITSGHFCAGIEIELGMNCPPEFLPRCKIAAPILKYMIGWTSQQISDYCKKKNWKVVFFIDEKKLSQS